MPIVKTPKGTELPLIVLKGKDYLQVQHRLVWFREEKPDWSIETEFVEKGPSHAVAKATVKDALGRVIATAHKYEDAQGFGDYREKAETGAIGRALAICGFGTQFTDELEEVHPSNRIVDAPVQRTSAVLKPGKAEAYASPPQISPQPPGQAQFDEFRRSVVSKEPHVLGPSNGLTDPPGDFVVRFGKYARKKVKDIPLEDLPGYVNYIKRSVESSGKKPDQKVIDLIDAMEGYLAIHKSSLIGRAMDSVNQEQDVP